MKSYLAIAIITIVTMFNSVSFASDIKAGAPDPAPTTQPLPQNVPAYLQDISVTIHAGGSQGSGVIKTRDGVNYVWTAAHVVADLRGRREVIDGNSGTSKTVVEFKDCDVVQELIESGRSVGQISMSAEVLRYSNAETGEDLALLRIRKKNFVSVSAQFYLGDTIPNVGTPLYHVGSLKGQFGSNSMTTGIVSQIGRVILDDNNVVFDQTTVTAFPGSSGGGVFLQDGRYYGMLVRGSGETFNFVVPSRRILTWADKVGVRFALDDTAAVPTDAELHKRSIEDNGSVEFTKTALAKPPGNAATSQPTKTQFLIEK